MAERKNKGSARRSPNDRLNDESRTANGRFAKGHCPNPHGRPRNEKARLGEALANILSREMELADGSVISMEEYLVMTAVNAARQDPRLALKILSLDPRRNSAALEQPAADESDDDNAVLQAFYERQKRQQRKAGSVRRPAPLGLCDGDGEGDDDEQ